MSATAYLPARGGLDALRAAAADCRGCDLYRDATQTVFGQGRTSARAVLLGEQPGDREDLAGEPFVGPVKHFSFRPADRGTGASTRNPGQARSRRAVPGWPGS